MTTFRAEPIKIFFPVIQEAVDWVEFSRRENDEQRTNLLKAQRIHSKERKTSSNRFPNCSCCEQAQFTVRYEEDKMEYSLVRMPNSSKLHVDGCPCKGEFALNPHSQSQTERNRGVGRDFRAALKDEHDPEFLPVKEETSRPGHSTSQNRRRSNSGTSTSLRRFGKELLQRAGVCDWHPRLAGRRDQRTINGLVAAAVDSMKGIKKWGQFYDKLGDVRVVPWSCYSQIISTPRSLSLKDSAIAFGFIETLSGLTESKARLITLSGNPEPILLPAALIADAKRNNEQPLDEERPSIPLWCIVVVRCHGGRWKAHAAACFRMTRRGGFPVSSDNEERFVEMLIREKRVFRRWLIPKPGVRDIPDFELMDVTPTKYLEVAGKMDDPDYRTQIERKVELYGCLPWDTRTPLDLFVAKLPIPNLTNIFNRRTRLLKRAK